MMWQSLEAALKVLLPSAPPPPSPPSTFDLFGLLNPPPPPPAPARGSPYLVAYVVLVLLSHCWEQYLRWRTRRRLQLKGVPNSVRAALGAVDEKEYARAQEYGTAKNNFGFLTDAVGLLRTLFDLRLMPYIWNNLTSQAVSFAGLGPQHELARMVVLSAVAMPLDLCISLPLSAYRTFVIEERFGFNKHTLRSWLGDSFKSLAVEQGMGLAMMCPLIVLLRNLGTYAWLYAWAFVTAFVLVFNMAYPTLISPLFNKFTPLAEGEAREAILRLVSATGLPCEKVFEVDGSRQSSHSNAYVTGFFGTKRIVLYDTLLTQLDGRTDDLCAVVAHEIGHSILGHNYLLLGHACVQLFATFFTYGLCATDANLATDFGYHDPCTFLTLQSFFLLYNGALSPVLAPALSAFTRALEFQADRYAHKLGYDLRPALQQISKENLGDPNPDPLVSLCHHSHPTLVQRCDAIEQLIAADKKGR